MSGAFDAWSGGRKITPSRLDQIQESIGGVDGLGFRPLTGTLYVIWQEILYVM